jgi:hypothetical protein
MIGAARAIGERIFQASALFSFSIGITALRRQDTNCAISQTEVSARLSPPEPRRSSPSRRRLHRGGPPLLIYEFQREREKMPVSEIDRPIVPHKAELALRAVRRNGVKTFADLGGCWGVNGGYTYFLADNTDIQHGYILDQYITKLTRERGSRYTNITLLGDRVFNDRALIGEFPKVDALIMYDILLHQVNLNWDEFITAWAKRTNTLIIYNQMWSLHANTVRFIDFGREWYKKWVPYPNAEFTDDWFDNFDAIDPSTQRRRRDTHLFWQWGITRNDLIKHVESLGFRLQYFEDYGPVETEFPWVPLQGFIFTREAEVSQASLSAQE